MMASFINVVATLLLVAGTTYCCNPSEIDNCATHIYHVFYHPEDFPTTAEGLQTRCDDGLVGSNCMLGMAQKCPQFEKGIKYFVNATKTAAGDYCENVQDAKNEGILSFGKCIKVDSSKKYTCSDLLVTHTSAATTLDTQEKKKEGICCAFRKMKSCVKDHVVSTCTDETALAAGRKFYETFTSAINDKCKQYELTDEKCQKLFEGVHIDSEPKLKSAMSSILSVYAS